MIYIQPVVEDQIQEQIIKKLFSEIRKDVILRPAIGFNGQGYIKKKILGFNKAAPYLPHAILTDLDQISCPPELIEQWFNFERSPQLLFRIAVREVESWLLADRENAASFLGVAINKIPLDTDEIVDPKELIINLAKKSSKRAIREDIVPQGISSLGPGYNLKLTGFIARKWNFELACQHSDSLRKTVERIIGWKIGN